VSGLSPLEYRTSPTFKWSLFDWKPIVLKCVCFFKIINHVINVEDMRHSDQKKTSCYDIDVEVDDTLKTQMNSFLLSTASQQVRKLI
jgi:hypothetical protein